MGGRNLSASRVYQTATRYLENDATIRQPPWYTTIGSIPPGEILTRSQPPQHREYKLHKRTRKPSKLFKPQFLEYEEDQLRKEFFRDHPWELARPRIVLEDDGKDGRGLDWSSIWQKGRPLTGENVVQRQLWLMENIPGISKAQAYDKARKEFYALRRQEELEQKVQKEEALWTGAQFGLSALEVGMVVEDKVFEKWKVYAAKEAEATRTRLSTAYAGPVDEEDEEEEGEEETGVTGGA